MKSHKMEISQNGNLTKSRPDESEGSETWIMKSFDSGRSGGG